MRNLLANALFIGLVVGFGTLSVLNPDAYYQHVQEDQPLEWATFWGFMIAGLLFLRASVLDRWKRPLPWFYLGVGAFCIVVAMEEISWGQRIFGYSPPRYFLENNFQQEFNLHNVMATSLRKQLLSGILVLYGVLLPIMSKVPATKRLLNKLGITAPPASLMLIFGALVPILVVYPLSYSGEIIEAGMAIGFLFAAVAAWDGARGDEAEPIQWHVTAGALSLVVLLGFGCALWSRGQLAADPLVAEVTATELRAIKRDLRELSDEGKLPCGKHERLNWMSKLSRSDVLAQGRFQALTRKGLPDERADFFIDPWSTAYWARTTCNEKRDKIFLYSFGPNRRRDSSRWKLRGDDIGLIFRVRKGSSPMAATATVE